MKKFAIFLVACLLLTGCFREKEPLDRVVTGVQVQFQQSSDTIERTYTKNSSIQSILTYLRFLKPFGPVLPKGEPATTCQFTLHYSHGQDTVYLQHGNDYLQKDGGDWQTIRASYGSLLYPMLLLLPSD